MSRPGSRLRRSEPAAALVAGSSLHCTGTRLYVGLPDGPSKYGTRYALPLSDVTAGAAPSPP
ncbi:hypothetical protein ACIQJT_26780 [Streptomyces sp. NPDC091972]|uniref:hypothetical protein n=1 Tax=unclassified Streptomyces TaxID=2593676 RepID=UPI0034252748